MQASIVEKTVIVAISEFAHGGHVAGLVLASMVFALGLLCGDPLNLPVLAISYLIPLIVYSYNYYEELESDRLTMPDRAAYLEKKVKIYPYLISGYVALLAGMIVLCEGQLLKLGVTVGILLAAGILYTLCLKRLTRYITGFKTYYVTGEWAIAFVLMYALYAGKAPEAFPLTILGFAFLRLLINTIYFDLKDIRSDGSEGLKTIPVVLGWDRTVRLLYLLNLLSAAPLAVGVLIGELPGFALALLGFILYDFSYLIHAELARGTDMALKDYAIADYEFILWPWAVCAGILLLDWLGPLATAALAILIGLDAAIRLFTRRTSSSC